MREGRDNRLSVRDLSVFQQTSPAFSHIVSLPICLSSHMAHHHQAIFQLTARVHVLMCAHVFVYVGSRICVLCVEITERLPLDCV